MDLAFRASEHCSNSIEIEAYIPTYVILLGGIQPYRSQRNPQIENSKNGHPRARMRSMMRLQLEHVRCRSWGHKEGDQRSRAIAIPPGASHA